MSLAHHSNLSHLSDDELIRHVDNGLDKLTSTEIEIELLARFEKHSNTLRDLSPVLEYLEENEATPESFSADLLLAERVRDLLKTYEHDTVDDLVVSLDALVAIRDAVDQTKISPATPNT